MSYIHKQLLKRGRLSDILPSEDDLVSRDRTEIEAAKADTQARAEEEREISKEVAAAIVRLNILDKRNHYGESLRKAFGGKW